MKFFLKIFIVAVLVVSVIGCTSGNADEPTVGNDRMAVLTLNVYAGDPGAEPSLKSRVDGEASEEVEFEKPAYVYERMHTLRVIVVRPNGLVEHNEPLSGDIPEEGSSEYHGVRLNVIGGEKKDIYLFANESAVPYDFTSIRIGNLFPVEAILGLQLQASDNGVLIDNTGDEKTYIPMSESFTIDVKAPEPDGSNFEQSADLFITRAAVKFGFFFSLEKAIPQDLYIKSITISKLGNTEFFLPRNAKYSPTKELLGFYDRYIYEYSVPVEVENKDYTFLLPEDTMFTPMTGAADEIQFTPQLYFAETGVKSYTVSVTLMMYKDEEKKKKEEFTIEGVKLDNLPILPRNTFVKINAAIDTKSLEADVDVVPYTSVWLEPKFGFNFLLPHVPIYGEKPPWVEIWPPEYTDPAESDPKE